MMTVRAGDGNGGCSLPLIDSSRHISSRLLGDLPDADALNVWSMGNETRPMVDPDLREQILQRAVQTLRDDTRVDGVILIGSGADGFIDDLSDIDLLAVIREEEDVASVHADWAWTVRRRFPVLHHARSPFTEANGLQIFILNDLLELDTSFVALSRLQPPWDRGRIIFDRTGALGDRLAHAKRGERNLADYLGVFDQACHRVMECRKALHRGKRWQAALVLDELRSLTMQLAGLVQTGSARQRDADRLPEAFLAMLSGTVGPVEFRSLDRSLRLLTTVMLDQAEQLYGRVGARFPRSFAAALLDAVNQGPSSPHEP